MGGAIPVHAPCWRLGGRYSVHTRYLPSLFSSSALPSCGFADILVFDPSLVIKQRVSTVLDDDVNS